MTRSKSQSSAPAPFQATKRTPAPAPQVIQKPQQPRAQPDVSPLQGIDPKMQELILNEVVQKDMGVQWDDIAGLDQAKQALYEMVILPMLRPGIWRGFNHC